MSAWTVHLSHLDRLIAGVGLAADELRRAAVLGASHGRHGCAVEHYRYEAEALLHELQDERRQLASIPQTTTVLLRLVA